MVAWHWYSQSQALAHEIVPETLIVPLTENVSLEAAALHLAWRETWNVLVTLTVSVPWSVTVVAWNGYEWAPGQQAGVGWGGQGGGGCLLAVQWQWHLQVCHAPWFHTSRKPRGGSAPAHCETSASPDTCSQGVYAGAVACNSARAPLSHRVHLHCIDACICCSMKHSRV